MVLTNRLGEEGFRFSQHLSLHLFNYFGALFVVISINILQRALSLPSIFPFSRSSIGILMILSPLSFLS